MTYGCTRTSTEPVSILKRNDKAFFSYGDQAFGQFAVGEALRRIIIYAISPSYAVGPGFEI
jgi:hypothetical protein